MRKEQQRPPSGEEHYADESHQIDHLEKTAQPALCQGQAREGGKDWINPTRHAP
jgi:hypothetical protein